MFSVATQGELTAVTMAHRCKPTPIVYASVDRSQRHGSVFLRNVNTLQ